MDPKTFKIDIVTPERVFFSGEASSLIAPGELGYLGVLANHAPLLTPLVPGRVTLKQRDGQKQFRIDRGFLEVCNNKALLLVDKVEDAPSSQE